jgi:tetratricopeptide (TPR) repeat protein
VVLGGCGVVGDMRADYVAHRALQEATQELRSRRPQLDQVRERLDLAYRLKSDDPRFMARLALPYHGIGQFAKAREGYEAAAAIGVGDFAVEIAVCGLMLEHPADSADRLERALNAAARKRTAGELSQARYVELLNLGGYSLADANVRLEDALGLIRQALNAEPLNAAYIDSLGWVYFRLGRFEEAAFQLERAARLTPQTNPEILWHLGAVHARTGRHHRAEGELRLALQLDPANHRARELLRRMLHELPPPAIA